MTDIEIIHEIEIYFGFQFNEVEYENLKTKNKFRINRIEGTHNFSMNIKGEVDGICLDFCQKQLPKDLLKSLQNIKFLSLRNSFSRNAISFKSFPNLESLDLCDNDLCDISFLSDIKNLNSIDLSYNKLTSVSILNGLYKLTKLNLKYNRGFKNLTPLIALKELTTLDLSHNKLNDITFLNKLDKLTSLNLRKTTINQIIINGGFENINVNVLANKNDYITLKDLKNLTTLDLSGVSLNSFSFIENLKALEVLKLDKNHLSNFEFLEHLTKLTSLSLRKNDITDIGFLKGLKELTSIDLSENSISDISVLNELDKLKEIQLKKNKIKEIPNGLLKFNLNINIDDKFAINCINLFNNPVEKPDLITIRQGYNAIKNWFESIKVENDEIKLVIIGNSTVGKTSLKEFLTNNRNPENKRTTHGISVSTWKPMENNLKVNIWDFGGQEYYHATHRLFLSNGAIYILLWDRKTDECIEQDTIVYKENGEEDCLRQRYYDKQYWLQTIRESFSTDSEILLVQNKIDEYGNEQKNAEDKLINQYNVNNQQFQISILNVYKYQITKNPQLKNHYLKYELFRDELLNLLDKKAKNQVIVKHISILREKIRLCKDHNYWTWKHYSDFCYYEAEEPISENQLQILTEYLHITGVIIYYGCDPNFSNNEFLKDVVFLNPNFITQSIYAILSTDTRKANGIFTRDYAINKIGDEFIAIRMIELMKSPNFELIFNYNNRPNTFYTTSYLSDNYPGNEEDFDYDSTGLKTNLTIYFNQYFTPSFFSRFLSSFGNRSNKGKIWKSGIFLAKNGERAFVECLFNEQKVLIKTTHGNLVKEILDEFIRIVGKTDFEISINGIDHFVSYLELIRNKYYPAFRYKNEEFVISDYLKLLDENDGKLLPTVVILTAIKEEYLAVKSHLLDIKDANQNGIFYEKGVFGFRGKSIAKVIIRECGSRNDTAAQETERAINYHNPNMILFVGIAGSIKPKDFKIGDVIFPEKIYSYEGGKTTNQELLVRPDTVSPTFELIEIAKKERLKNDWKELIIGDYSNDINANIGIIASGELVIDDLNSEIGKILTEHFNDTSAVEMEGYGFAKAATRQCFRTKKITIGVIRGISDTIGEIIGEKRPQNIKEFASNTASAFAYWLIYKFYDNENN